MRIVGDVTTERLLGRRPIEGDEEDYVRIWTDLRVPEDAWPAELRTTDDARRVLRESIAHWERWGFGPWTVVEHDTRAVIGRVGLRHTIVAGQPEVEVGWFLSGDVWGQGYATEMAREAVRAGFDALELSDLVSFTTPANVASRAVIGRLGFHFEAEIEHAGLPHLLFRLRRADRAPD